MESFPVQAQRLLGQDPSESNDSPTRVWSGFLLSHWDLQNVHPELISIDRRIQDQSDDDDDEDENGATGQLVDLS